MVNIYRYKGTFLLRFISIQRLFNYKIIEISKVFLMKEFLWSIFNKDIHNYSDRCISYNTAPPSPFIRSALAKKKRKKKIHTKYMLLLHGCMHEYMKFLYIEIDLLFKTRYMTVSCFKNNFRKFLLVNGQIR